MAKAKIDVKFPCGYEMKIDVDGGWFSDPIIEGLGDKCPLHGKDCPPSKK